MAHHLITGRLKVFEDQQDAFINLATGRNDTRQYPDLKERWLIVGAGGFGREVYAWTFGQLCSDSPGASVGFLDDSSTSLEKFPALRSLWVDRISEYVPQPGDRLLMAIADPVAKLQVGKMLIERGATFASYIHPNAVISQDTQIGTGCILCPNAVVTCNVRIGDFVTMNIGALVGHDCVVNDGCTLSPNADVLGQAELQRGVFLGCKAVILPKTKIGEFARIGAGSVVIGHVRAFSTMMGAPAKRVNWSKNDEEPEKLAA